MITIVWLDDRPQEVLDLYTQFLEDNGCTIAMCEDYDAFFERWRPENVDIIISNWMVDGDCVLDFAQKLRTSEEYVNHPLLVVTEDDNQNNITRGLVGGIDDYLLKPVNNHILVGKIKYQLRDGHFFSNSLLMKKHTACTLATHSVTCPPFWMATSRTRLHSLSVR